MADTGGGGGGGTDRKDPLMSGWFAVEFQEMLTGVFKEVGGLTTETEVNYMFQSDKQGKRFLVTQPGNPKITNITLRRGMTDDMKAWDWYAKVEAGNMTEARKNGSITMYDQDNKELVRFNIVNAWPCKISAPDLDSEHNTVLIEEIEIAHEGMQRKAGGGGAG